MKSAYPVYRCHKLVRAFRIHAIIGQRIFPIDAMEPRGAPPYDASVEFMDRHRPNAGGYLVFYEDGHVSFSPAEAFEAGYTRMEDAE